jgi:hypothetical protein
MQAIKEQERRMLSEEELLFERARSAAILLETATRIRFNQVEALLGDQWVRLYSNSVV